MGNESLTLIFLKEVNRIMNLFKRLVNEEEGQGLVEYGLIIAVVAVALITALTTLKGGISTVFSNAETKLKATY